jgi:hypothetical protein
MDTAALDTSTNPYANDTISINTQTDAAADAAAD